MATLKSIQFQAILDGPVAPPVLTHQQVGNSLHYEVAFPAAVAVGDNMIVGYLDNKQPLPELGFISSDGGATALTVDVGHGEYDTTSGVLTVTNVDSIVDGYVATSADSTRLLHDDAPTAGVFTRIESANTRVSKTVIIVTAVAETSGELANLIISIPTSPVKTS